MLATIIILAIIVAIAIVIFAVKAANLRHQIEDIYAKQAILHDKYCNHEDRIDGNYKSLAELNRRQDEADKVGNSRYAELCGGIKGLQEYNVEKEEKAKKAREEFNKLLGSADGIVMVRECTKKQPTKKAAKAKNKAQAPEQPAIDPRETRDIKQKAAENRKRFAELRKYGCGIYESANDLGISYTTAKRYEKWRKERIQ